MLDQSAEHPGGKPDSVPPSTTPQHPPIRFENAEDFRRRARFREHVEVKGRYLAGYIGDYDFPKSQWLNCGLTCKRLHGAGFVVLLDNGIETNIGNCCGKSHFGLDWDEMTRKCDEDRTRAVKLDLVSKGMTERDKTLAAARALRMKVHAADVELKPIREMVESDPALRRAFARCCKAYGALFHDRYLTEDERAMSPGQTTIREKIGTIDGYAAAPENDLDRELRVDVIDALEAMQPIDVARATEKQLAERLRQIRAREGIIQRAELFVADAKRLLRKSNWVALETLCATARLGVSRKTRDRLRDIAGMPQPKY